MGNAGVRPTIVCLSDLGLTLPKLTDPLQTLQHPLLAKAQSLPDERDAGGLQPVLSLKDREWWKVKAVHYRGAATEISDIWDSETPIDLEAAKANGANWWVCKAGTRQEDSADDFYRLIQAKAKRLVSAEDKKRGRTTDTTSWLPAARDLDRLKAETAARFVIDIRETVVGLIARSMRDGKVWRAEASGQSIAVVVRADDGEAYLAVGATGYYDEKIVAIMLDAVPGISADDWLVEPTKIRMIEPASGEVVFSAVIPPATQTEVLNVELPPDWADAAED